MRLVASGAGDECCPMGVTVRMVDLITLPKDLIVLVLLCALWDVVGLRDGGLWSNTILLRRLRLPPECKSRG